MLRYQRRFLNYFFIGAPGLASKKIFLEKIVNNDRDKVILKIVSHKTLIRYNLYLIFYLQCRKIIYKLRKKFEALCKVLENQLSLPGSQKNIQNIVLQTLIAIFWQKNGENHLQKKWTSSAGSISQRPNLRLRGSSLKKIYLMVIFKNHECHNCFTIHLSYNAQD